MKKQLLVLLSCAFIMSAGSIYGMQDQQLHLKNKKQSTWFSKKNLPSLTSWVSIPLIFAGVYKLWNAKSYDDYNVGSLLFRIGALGFFVSRFLSATDKSQYKSEKLRYKYCSGRNPVQQQTQKKENQEEEED